jgi:hypothetical protein
MSCNCENQSAGTAFPCLCDQFIFPTPLNIGAGLSSLPRQIATFPEFRRAMLLLAQGEEVSIIDENNIPAIVKPLSNWRARDKDDLGIMLLEMWAYVCDSLSFYDEVIADEVYVRTCTQRADLRRLVALLGYLPRPAVGSLVKLAALADGRLDLKLPAGTAFSSGAFDGNPPQIFELDNDATINPLTNQWDIISPHVGKIVNANPAELVVSQQSEIKEDALLLLWDKNNAGQNQGLAVKSVVKYKGVDGKQYTKLIFTAPTNLAAGTLLSGLRLMRPTQSTGLWPATLDSGIVFTGAGGGGGFAAKLFLIQLLTLNSLAPAIHPADLILLVYNNEQRWFKVTAVETASQQATPDSTMTINGNLFKLPGVTTSVTQLTLDAFVNSSARKAAGSGNWHDSISNGITVHFGMQPAATVIDEPQSALSPGDLLYLDGAVEAPIGGVSPLEFQLKDKNTIGADVGGSVNFSAKQLILNAGTKWSPDLTLPVKAYGNVITASRGQTVKNEILGSGDATAANQSFKLQKKPLTYHLSPTTDNANGVSNSLTVYIDGIRWTEVNTFYGATAYDQVYIVRQNDEGDSLVTFGDGIRGERVPTGANNIVANYRFGAEAACPPAGSVNQISKPVTDLQGVNNMLAAFGGDDAELADDLRTYAPKSALILGRVVSLNDMEALAAQFPGVRAVKAEWRWNNGIQQAAAHIFYIGDDGIRSALSKRIRNLSDPTITIGIEQATGKLLPVSLNIQIDPKYLESDVMQQVRQSLTDPDTGILAPENIGIGLPLYRSALFEAVLKINGTTAVTGISLNGSNFVDFAVTPGAGNYYDVENGGLLINGN